MATEERFSSVRTASGLRKAERERRPNDMLGWR
jgi:hypothetical protein